MRRLASIRSAMLLVAMVTACAPAQRTSVPLYDDLGTYSYAVTATPEAQRYFDQGIRLYYAFNHAEAIRAFEAAARLDERCAMCLWGVALSYGPNINAAMDSASGVAAFHAIREAQARLQHVTPREAALIRALAARYVEVPPADRAPLDSAYAIAMRRVAEEYPNDIDASVLYAESLMDLSPWHYWNDDGTPRPGTSELLRALEHVLSERSDQPGANHFYIHAVEEVDPARALPMAERLAGLMPGAGHIVHMPGHIYVRVGRYEDAIGVNEHAVHADETYIRDQRPSPGTYTGGYYPHNYDFLAFAASMVGRSGQALEAARKLESIATPELMGAPGMTFTQHHDTRHLQLAVRFGRWDEIQNAAAPAEEFQHARAMWHYARGRAFAARGDLPAARAELASLHAIARDSTLAATRLEFNTAGALHALAGEVLAGHIAAAAGDHDRAVTHLREAVRHEDALNYGEPPEWTIPVRQDLGSVLLRAGRAKDAEAAFREDLRHFPDNGWSLHGLAESLRAQGKTGDAAQVEQRFNTVWSRGDSPPGASHH